MGPTCGRILEALEIRFVNYLNLGTLVWDNLLWDSLLWDILLWDNFLWDNLPPLGDNL